MKKLKRTSVGNVERENERDQTYEAKNPKIDLSRTHDNYHIIALPQSYMEFINERIASLNLKRKVRSDAIYMNTFVLSSGHEFFENMPLDRQEEFFEDCVKFFADKYGAENIISAVVHMDETTPHLHLNLVPITGGKLCSKDLFSPKKLSYLDGIVQSVESTADKPIPTKRKHAEDEIKTLRAQNAALQKSLYIKSKDAADLFTQLQRAERLGRGKDSAFRMVSDMIAAYPDEFDELLKKSREKKASPNYKANSRDNDRGGK